MKANITYLQRLDQLDTKNVDPKLVKLFSKWREHASRARDKWLEIGQISASTGTEAAVKLAAAKIEAEHDARIADKQAECDAAGSSFQRNLCVGDLGMLIHEQKSEIAELYTDALADSLRQSQRSSKPLTSIQKKRIDTLTEEIQTNISGEEDFDVPFQEYESLLRAACEPNQ